MSIKNNTPDLQGILDTINTLPDYVDTTGTATAADIYTGKTATVNAKKLTGTNPYNAANVDPAVADALAALVEKGVDTTGAGLAELAALIGGIETGGIMVTTGSLTPASKISTKYVVSHGLGTQPQYFIMYGAENPADQSNWSLHYAVAIETTDICKQINLYRSSAASEVFKIAISNEPMSVGTSSTYFGDATEETITILNGNTAYGDIPAGYTYEWVAIGGIA